MATKPKQIEVPLSISAQVLSLTEMPINDLRDLWRATFKSRAPTDKRRYLERRLCNPPFAPKQLFVEFRLPSVAAFETRLRLLCWASRHCTSKTRQWPRIGHALSIRTNACLTIHGVRYD